MSSRFMGVDIHKRFCVFTELDSKGNVIKRGKFGNNIKELSVFAGSLDRSVQLVVEPVLNYLWFLDQVESYVHSVHLATPFKVRIIAESKAKTDRYDSRMLAELLRINFLPESFIAPREVRELRELIRQRYHLVRNRAMMKNRIRHLLFLNGSQVRAKDVSSAKALKEMRSLPLPGVTGQSIAQYQRLIKELNQTIKSLESEIIKRSRGIEMVELLQTIPGIGCLFAVIIYAEVVDIHRFKNRKAFASYTGLTPMVRASGNKVITGGITRIGSKPLRTVLVEAALKAPRHSPSLNRMFMRIQYRSSVQKARVAVAHKLALIIYAMLKNKEPFRG